MADINLLPQELKPNKSVLIIARKLKQIAVISSSLLVLAFLLVIGTKYYFSRKTKESLSRQVDLESQIKSMENTEQQLVLIKDRIEKIISIVSKGTISEEIDVVNNISGILPEGMQIKDISMDKDLVGMTVVTGSLKSASQYINSVTSLSGLRYVNLISFDFSPISGYTIELNFIAVPKKTPSISSADELDSGMSSSFRGNSNRIIGEAVIAEPKKTPSVSFRGESDSSDVI
jgi:hypothetical protein